MTSALDRLEAAVCDESPITRAQQMDLVADLLARRNAKPYHCPTCIEDYAESFCPSCGLDLVLDLVADSATPKSAGGNSTEKGRT